MKTPSGLWLVAMLALTACQQGDSDPGPGGVTLGEARALDEAAEMIEQHRPPASLLDKAAPDQPAAAPQASGSR